MGTLYIVATPIGNLEDISLRAIRVLFSVPVIACEDTRRAGMLLSELRKRHEDLANLSTEPQLFRYDDRTEHTATPSLIQMLTAGTSVALISDAGTPLLSDPGYILVREARRRRIPIISVPGASALLCALTGSGLAADKFLFLGYPPEKRGHRVKLFRSLSEVKRVVECTYVLYAAPHKLREMLSDMRDVFGAIDVVRMRELTKLHEEYWQGPLTQAIEDATEPKGEYVVLFRL